MTDKDGPNPAPPDSVVVFRIVFILYFYKGPHQPNLANSRLWLKNASKIFNATQTQSRRQKSSRFSLRQVSQIRWLRILIFEPQKRASEATSTCRQLLRCCRGWLAPAVAHTWCGVKAGEGVVWGCKGRCLWREGRKIPVQRRPLGRTVLQVHEKVEHCYAKK